MLALNSEAHNTAGAILLRKLVKATGAWLIVALAFLVISWPILPALIQVSIVFSFVLTPVWLGIGYKYGDYLRNNPNPRIEDMIYRLGNALYYLCFAHMMIMIGLMAHTLYAGMSLIGAVVTRSKQDNEERARLAYLLNDRILGTHTPRRVSVMTGKLDQARKYVDDKHIRAKWSLTTVLEHLDQRQTYAMSLLLPGGYARAGVRDYDDSDIGEDLAREALRRASAAGVVATAFLLKGRAHVWYLYRNEVPADDIAAQIATLAPAGEGEIYPSGNNIRLPFGYHKTRKTRGVLVLQNGDEYDLDNPAQFVTALRVWVALSRNANPPKAPPNWRKRRAGGSVQVDPANWTDLPDGASLMATTRYSRIFERRTQLATLARGERVQLQCVDGDRDSGSEQVAVLVSSLLTMGRVGPDGRIVPGLGAPPLAEIRAVALHWRDALRPGYDLDAYRADVDRLIDRYRPDGYAPEATKGRASEPAPAPAPLAPRGRGRPAGALATALDTLVTLLRPGVTVTRASLAMVMGVSPRTITSYLANLVATGRLDYAPAPRGIVVRRVETNSEPAPAEGGNYAPFSASECGAIHREVHTPPLVPLAAETVPDSPALVDSAPALSGQIVQMTPAPAPALVLAPIPALALALAPAPVLVLAPKIETNWTAFVAESVAAYGYRWRAIRAAAGAEFGKDGYDQAELRRAYDAHPWLALRAELRGMRDRDLLARCKAAARQAQAMARKPQARYWSLRFELADEERRRRGLSLLPGGRQTRATRDEARAGAAAAAGRLTQFRDQADDQADDQAELWALVDSLPAAPVTTWRPKVRLGQNTSTEGGVCYSPPGSTASLCAD